MPKLLNIKHALQTKKVIFINGAPVEVYRSPRRSRATYELRPGNVPVRLPS